MKKNFILLFVFCKLPTFGQLLIDHNIKSKIENVFNNQTNPNRFNAIDSSSVYGGITLVTRFKVDTLNLNDFKPTIDSLRFVEVDIETDSITGKTIVKDKKIEGPQKNSNALPFISTCYTSRGILNIEANFGFFSGLGFYFKIRKDKVNSDFIEYSKRDKIFKTTIKSKLVKFVKTKSYITNFKLSSRPKTIGDTFYGEGTLTTNGFFVEDANFKNGFICKRYIIDFVFKLKLINPPK